MGLAGMGTLPWILINIPSFIKRRNARASVTLAGTSQKSTSRKMTECVFTTAICAAKTGCQIHARHDDTVIYNNGQYIPSAARFIVDEEHFSREATNEVTVPYPVKWLKNAGVFCSSTGLSLSGMVMQNELALHNEG